MLEYTSVDIDIDIGSVRLVADEFSQDGQSG
jgi:hypothetical protein